MTGLTSESVVDGWFQVITSIFFLVCGLSLKVFAKFAERLGYTVRMKASGLRLFRLLLFVAALASLLMAFEAFRDNTLK